MVHFTFYAGKTYTYKEEGNKNPIGQAVQDGYHQERFDPKQSKYSYEDLPSDKFGATFGATKFDPKSAKTISEQMKDYVNNELKPADPKTAPNWNTMPAKEPKKGETKKPPTATNKTTKPMFTPPPAPTPAPAKKQEGT